jgi:hypothetical protein
MTPETVAQLIRQALVMASCWPRRCWPSNRRSILHQPGADRSFHSGHRQHGSAAGGVPVGFPVFLPWLIQKTVGYTIFLLGDLARCQA